MSGPPTMTVRVAQPQPDRMDQPVGFILKTYLTRASGATPEERVLLVISGGGLLGFGV